MQMQEQGQGQTEVQHLEFDLNMVQEQGFKQTHLQNQHQNQMQEKDEQGEEQQGEQQEEQDELQGQQQEGQLEHEQDGEEEEILVEEEEEEEEEEEDDDDDDDDGGGDDEQGTGQGETKLVNGEENSDDEMDDEHTQGLDQKREYNGEQNGAVNIDVNANNTKTNGNDKTATTCELNVEQEVLLLTLVHRYKSHMTETKKKKKFEEVYQKYIQDPKSKPINKNKPYPNSNELYWYIIKLMRRRRKNQFLSVENSNSELHKKKISLIDELMRKRTDNGISPVHTGHQRKDSHLLHSDDPTFIPRNPNVSSEDDIMNQYERKLHGRELGEQGFDLEGPNGVDNRQNATVTRSRKLANGIHSNKLNGQVYRKIYNKQKRRRYSHVSNDTQNGFNVNDVTKEQGHNDDIEQLEDGGLEGETEGNTRQYNRAEEGNKEANGRTNGVLPDAVDKKANNAVGSLRNGKRRRSLSPPLKDSLRQIDMNLRKQQQQPNLTSQFLQNQRLQAMAKVQRATRKHVSQPIATTQAKRPGQMQSSKDSTFTVNNNIGQRQPQLAVANPLKGSIKKGTNVGNPSQSNVQFRSHPNGLQQHQKQQRHENEGYTPNGKLIARRRNSNTVNVIDENDERIRLSSKPGSHLQHPQIRRDLSKNVDDGDPDAVGANVDLDLDDEYEGENEQAFENGINNGVRQHRQHQQQQQQQQQQLYQQQYQQRLLHHRQSNGNVNWGGNMGSGRTSSRSNELGEEASRQLHESLAGLYQSNRRRNRNRQRDGHEDGVNGRENEGGNELDENNNSDNNSIGRLANDGDTNNNSRPTRFDKLLDVLKQRMTLEQMELEQRIVADERNFQSEEEERKRRFAIYQEERKLRYESEQIRWVTEQREWEISRRRLLAVEREREARTRSRNLMNHMIQQLLSDLRDG